MRDALRAHAPDAVVNCAAFVDVDAPGTASRWKSSLFSGSTLNSYGRSAPRS
ncbi:hypothetical protein AQF52_4386 [Streptomyces venezuelae]|uniref:hypothetical protein n=1 Tax=Streptomyces gardneri TaxID=66892 RepID=UPI000720640D|nr:hypothetical protein [Streptomyces gardneri]ALO09980.1 hypothetical protein AQF52_4386 [Streptomyces venezuelae]WRK38436.1 hypothetical protein U0M97_22100 [Streptomyces venezuelae]